MRADSHGSVRLVNGLLNSTLTSAHGLRYPQENIKREANVKRSIKRAKERAKRKAERQAAQHRHGHTSNYARKREFLMRATSADEALGRRLAKDGGFNYTAERRLFGFDYDGVKPWRSAS